MRCEDDECSCCGVDRGPQGLRGFQGSNDLQGPQGTRGFQSEIVLPGVQGPQGPQGFMTAGERGPQGLKGEETVGLQGPIGKKGLENVGVQGLQGSSGFDGPQGTMSIGPMGPQGFDAAGTQGFQGLTGFQNATLVGPQGPSGQPSFTTTNQQEITLFVTSLPTVFTTFDLSASNGTYVLMVNGSVEHNDFASRNFTLAITGNNVNERVSTRPLNPITTFNLQTQAASPSTSLVQCSIAMTNVDETASAVVRFVLQAIKMI